MKKKIQTIQDLEEHTARGIDAYTEQGKERHYDPARRLLKTMQKAGAINQSVFNHYWALLAEKDKEFEL